MCARDRATKRGMLTLARLIGASLFLCSMALACEGAPPEAAKDDPATEPAGTAGTASGPPEAPPPPAPAPPVNAADAGGDAAPPATPGSCVRAGEHRMPGSVCCAGEGEGQVPEYSLCCRAAGGACDTTVPNPDAFCCAPFSKCNRASGVCEARTCAAFTEACQTGLPCCDGELRCEPSSTPGAPPPPNGFGRCCRPDGQVAKQVRPGQYDCCSTAVYSAEGGPVRCGPHP